MHDFLYGLMPNVVDRFSDFLTAGLETLQMLAWSGVYIFIAGMFLGIVITVAKPGGIMENKIIYQVIDKLINLFRSIPFIILLTALMPLSRAIMGTAIFVRGAIVPLVFGTVPFFARQIEAALAQTDYGLIEAALSMGDSPIKIIFRVYLKESIPQIARSTTITIISLIGLTAMAGAVGAGGLGDFAIRYGHDRNMTDITWLVVIVLVIGVSIIQGIGEYIVRKTRH